MDLEYYKAASEATDANERALIPGFKRIRPQYKTCPKCGCTLYANDDRPCKWQGEAWDEAHEHNEDLRQESLQAEREEHLREAWLDQRHLHDERDQ